MIGQGKLRDSLLRQESGSEIWGWVFRLAGGSGGWLAMKACRIDNPIRNMCCD